MENKISAISYPNTVSEDKQNTFYASKCKIEIIEKNGEMTKVNWFRISKPRTDGYAGYEVIAEIKESVCDIYYN